MALPKIQKKATVNDLIKNYNNSQNTTSRIVPKSTITNSNIYKQATSTIKNALSTALNNAISASSSSNKHGGGGRRLMDDGSSIDLKTGVQKTPAASNESVADILRANYPTLTSGGGGSYSGNPAGMVDISEMLKAFEQAAETNRAVTEQSYNSQRTNLLNELKRYQEQNAKDVANQQKAYLANQALVESAISEADRQNRINAAARGLGGSGLQQLSQLQTLMSQGQTISDMATQNQEAVDNLRTLLANYAEDNTNALNDLEKTKENTLMGINSDLATNKANLEYQAREAAASRAQMAASTNAQIAAENARYEAEAKAQERALNSEIATLNKNYQKELDTIKDMSDKDIKKYFKDEIKAGASIKNYNDAKKYIYNSYYDLMGTTLNNYTVGGTSFADTQYNNLYDLYKAAASSYVKPVSASTKAANQSLLGKNIAVQNSLAGNLFNKNKQNPFLSA